MKLGLALSGGGVRGAVHIGILKALEENKIFPNLVSGTSAGSIVAALYSIGYTPDEIQKMVIDHANSLNLDFNIDKIYYFFKSLVSGEQKCIDGLIKGDKIKHIFDYCFGKKNCKYIKDVKIPIAIPTVDINTGKICMFTSNKKKKMIDNEDICYDDDIDLATAVRASVSYPVVFSPYISKGKKLVDGGIRINVPVDILLNMGAEKVLAVNLGYAGQVDNGLDSILEIAAQSLDIMAYQLSKDLCKNASFVLKPKVYDINMFDATKIPECIERGYKAAVSAMPDIKKALYG